MSAAAMPKSRLGRGLAALMGEQANPSQPSAVAGNVAALPHIAPVVPQSGEQRLVPIDQVRPSPLNPRREFREDELDELASSIRQKGLVQPLIVRPSLGCS